MTEPQQEFKECSECLLQKPLDSFRIKKDNSREGRAGYERHYGQCKDCEVKKNSTRIKRRYDLVYAFSEVCGCEMCGTKDVRVLVFDHLDRSTKEEAVGQLVVKGSTLDKIWREVSKCRVLCANCHAIHTAEQMNYYSHHYISSQDNNT